MIYVREVGMYVGREGGGGICGEEEELREEGGGGVGKEIH